MSIETFSWRSLVARPPQRAAGQIDDHRVARLDAPTLDRLVARGALAELFQRLVDLVVAFRHRGPAHANRRRSRPGRLAGACRTRP